MYFHQLSWVPRHLSLQSRIPVTDIDGFATSSQNRRSFGRLGFPFSLDPVVCNVVGARLDYDDLFAHGVFETSVMLWLVPGIRVDRRDSILNLERKMISVLHSRVSVPCICTNCFCRASSNKHFFRDYNC